MDTLRISATAHGINYLPEYYAAASGGFARRGLQVTARPRDPWTGVLDDLADGSADLALGGIWAPAMYAGVARDLVTVGQLNGRFPMVIVTRTPVEDFTWSWMTGHVVLVPGAGGTAMYEFTAGLMREVGVNPAGTRFVRDLSGAMLGELFEGGLGDAFVTDPLTAMDFEQRGVASIACRLADAGGPMPNSVYYTRRDRVPELQDRLVRFLSAIAEAMATLNSASVDLAGLLAAEWPDMDGDVLSRAAADLIANGTWSGIRVDRAACDRWTGILRDAGLLANDPGYADLVDTSAVDAAEQAQTQRAS